MRRPTDGALIDRFRGRLMIPIADGSGRVLGFGARVLEGAPKTIAKYVNSKDSPV